MCAHAPPTQWKPTWEDERKETTEIDFKKKKFGVSGESWDRSKWAGERILEKWKCGAGGHPEANLTWVISDLFQLWARACGPVAQMFFLGLDVAQPIKLKQDWNLILGLSESNHQYLMGLFSENIESC